MPELRYHHIGIPTDRPLPAEDYSKKYKLYAIKRLKKAGLHLIQPIGAWCWLRKAQPQQHKQHWKNYAALIGDRFMASCGDRAPNRRRQRISLRVMAVCEAPSSTASTLLYK
jgi:hypothetical protein